MLEQYVEVGRRRLRCGYTTGTCAAAAAGAAAEFLLSKRWPEIVVIDTPSGIAVSVEIEETRAAENSARCGARKDGGDDIDATDGMMIFCEVALQKEPGALILGGEGVGRVTKPGLDQPPGEAAINTTPRRMIAEQMRLAAGRYGYGGGFCVTVSAPEGERRAPRTYNPVLGVTGGISILGTGGIVRPMSEAAIVDTIRAEIHVKAAEGLRDLILTPGNIGAAYAHSLMLDMAHAAECSNHIGEAIDFAALEGFQSVLLVGHAGKLVKVASGVMNTHSRYADCRMETLCAHAALCGAKQEVIAGVMACVAVDEAIEILERANLREPVIASVMEKMEQHLKRRAWPELEIGAVMFTEKHGLLGKTKEADALLRRHPAIEGETE
ncbi:MAG: cobalamin biosynthesis protein CbiD [Oscillospiraceae bacterium]|nr:cobalamin biosynthesis protein CbiD [Oscillospiraceae bacterium]